MTDFMGAVRQHTQRLADVQTRKSRLAGRPLTGAEAAAPYQALAATAGERIAQQKALALKEREVGIGEDYGTRHLDITEQNYAQQADLQRQQLAENQRQADMMMKFNKKQMEAQMAAAQQARESDASAQKMQLATLGAGLGVAAISQGWGGDIAKSLGSSISSLVKSVGSFFGGLF
jgi:FKBP-type peptidyl-prolyl cis-trans isomerase